MSKHIVDRPKDRSKDSRLEHYTEIEKREGGGQSKREKALYRKEKPREGDERLKRYTDIERRKED